MEKFKFFDEVITVDQRNTSFVLQDRTTGKIRPQELRDHYELVSMFTLNEEVPERVQSHFNTAKNALLYTWFFYGFYPIAELQALSALELALRERIGKEGLKQLKKKKKNIGIQTFIEYAVENEWIRNEDFSAYHIAPKERARMDYLIRKIKEMNVNGLDSIEINYREVEVPVENTTNFLEILMNTIHKVRNIHAHGNTMLLPASVWKTFEICRDFINALFREHDDQSDS